MTNQEYILYSDIVTKFFNYMNGRINTLNNQCILDIEPYDYVSNLKATIRYPNNITIYIGNSVDSWNDKWSNCIDKHSFITAILAWAVAHELFHADQLIAMMNYLSDVNYRKRVEYDVENSSYEWVKHNSDILNRMANSNFNMDIISSPTLCETSNYKKASIKQYYLQTICHIIIHDYKVFNNLKSLTDDSFADNIWLNFNDADCVQIKKDGHFIRESINKFVSLAYDWAGCMTCYDVFISERAFNLDSKKCAEIKFEFSNQSIDPIEYRKDDIQDYGQEYRV